MEDALMTLSQYHGAPAVTILLSTHRTHPDNKQDAINQIGRASCRERV